jgi:uncharacterized protein (DUF427 family)
VACADLVEVRYGGCTVASTTRSVRVLETSQAPAYYLPFDDVDLDVLVRSDRRSRCEWKGIATYWHVAVPGAEVLLDTCWSYDDPTPEFAGIRGHLACYPHRLDCTVAGERVEANAGDFYGGWITSRVAGPFKGAPGTLHW